MARRYYSSRIKPKKLTVEEFYRKLQSLYLMFRDKDYFKEKAGITDTKIPDAIQHEAAIDLPFQPFPITKWSPEDVTEDHILDVIEFLYDRVSKPEGWEGKTTETGYNYYDYESYNEKAGRDEFREKANTFLAEYGTGYELSADGVILALGSSGLQYILDADIVPYDELNVDSKVRDAIAKWRNRHLSLSEKREAIRTLADVFEWLKKTGRLKTVLGKKDDSALFEIANKFAVRHHDPGQLANYDRAIWYSWIFHFYLATYHAVVRLLVKDQKSITQRSSRTKG